MESTVPVPVEGQLYKVIHIDEHRFELRYGYNEDFERASGHPVVLFPDLGKNPVHTRDGYPVVTAVQEPCRYYTVPEDRLPEQWCADCVYYPGIHQEVGICRCEMRRQRNNENTLQSEEGAV